MVVSARMISRFPNKTPVEIAQVMLRIAWIGRLTTLLEPSAGDGTIAFAARDAGARVTCVELNDGMAAGLRAFGFVTHHADFLKQMPCKIGRFERIVMNPPRNAVAHIQHAVQFLRPQGFLVALHRMDAKHVDQLDGLLIEARLLPADTFMQDGQPVPTRIIVIRS
jgi:hypothetical protein